LNIVALLIEFKIIRFANILKKERKRISFMKKTLLPLSNNITNSIPKSKKQVSIKPKLITKYRLVFETLKEKLCSILILVFLNFEYLFILYYNSSKKCKYNIVLYQIRENSIKYFILYLLKVLNLAKKNY